MIKAQRKRMKEIEKDVANLKKEERGLGVKKAKARKLKLDMHLQKMTALVVEEQKAREQAQKDVAMLTEEVAVYSAKFEEICREVDGLMSVKHRWTCIMSSIRLFSSYFPLQIRSRNRSKEKRVRCCHSRTTQTIERCRGGIGRHGQVVVW